MIFIQIIILLVLAMMLRLMFLFNSKVNDIYELQTKFNNNERAYANVCQRQYEDSKKKISKLETELKIKNEIFEKMYEGQCRMAKAVKEKIK